MIIYPAIDLREGNVVRLRHGDQNQQTTYSDDPIAIAKQWKDAGASWLHVVNLDGTLGKATDNLDILQAIAHLDLSVQFGGGLRTLPDVQKAIDAGATRVVIGTLAVQHPEKAVFAAREFGAEHVAIALDARDGQVATHGWKQQSEWSPLDLGTYFSKNGGVYALYTDISRDGAMTGVNVEATAKLARSTGLKIIASGGVASLDDIRALNEVDAAIDGVIVGKALYDGAFTLQEAIALTS